MASHTSDRQRMRNDLRELAKLATPSPAHAETPHAFDSADSSGYVDLSAFSARDPAWVDRELARAKRGGPPPLPPGLPAAPSSKRIDALSPASMSPVALESFVVPDDTASVRPSRGRRWLVGVASLAGVGVVAFLAVTLAKHPPPAAAPAPQAAAAPAPPPPAAEPIPSPAVTAPATTPSPAATTPPADGPAASAPLATSPTTPSKKKPTIRASHAHAAPASAPATAPAAAPPKVAAAVKPAVIPQSHPSAGGGGDSLMDLIKKSVASGK